MVLTIINQLDLLTLTEEVIRFMMHQMDTEGDIKFQDLPTFLQIFRQHLPRVLYSAVVKCNKRLLIKVCGGFEEDITEVLIYRCFKQTTILSEMLLSLGTPEVGKQVSFIREVFAASHEYQKFGDILRKCHEAALKGLVLDLGKDTETIKVISGPLTTY